MVGEGEKSDFVSLLSLHDVWYLDLAFAVETLSRRVHLRFQCREGRFAWFAHVEHRNFRRDY